MVDVENLEQNRWIWNGHHPLLIKYCVSRCAGETKDIGGLPLPALMIDGVGLGRRPPYRMGWAYWLALRSSSTRALIDIKMTVRVNYPLIIS